MDNPTPHRRLHPCTPIVALAALLLAVATVQAAAPDGRIAPLLDGMGSHQHSISTDDPMAQRYFNQGLVLTFNFNHAEAARSFEEAARRDPDCAICWWGVALVLGPNPNSVMEDDAVALAWAALAKARTLAPRASDPERAYIAALSTRYGPTPVEDRSALDLAYAAAMRELTAAYPDDLDAATLFAESLMVTTPWDYWQDDGQPKPVARELIAVLESVIARNPTHPGANHLYIHAVEAEQPEKAVAAADRLQDLVPGAGHLQHMPSHIYIRVGRYQEAARANEIAIAADDQYVTQCHAQGLYPLTYMPHNRHFLWAAATLAGRSETALRAAAEMADKIDQETMREAGLETLQHYWVTPLYALTRFGRWQEILEFAQPEDDLLYPQGVWRYARAMAYARSGRTEEARVELAALEAVAEDDRLESITVWEINTTAALLAIAVETVRGEIAAAEGDYTRATVHLERGVELQDGLNYDEPDPWHASVRHTLGAVYLQAGRPESARDAFLKDLETFPDNGWALAGLEAALRALGETAQADQVHARFEVAWQHADVTLDSARF